MEHEFLQLELILWIGVLIIVFLGFLVIYMKYKSDKTKYLMGIALFFALFFVLQFSFMNKREKIAKRDTMGRKSRQSVQMLVTLRKA